MPGKRWLQWVPGVAVNLDGNTGVYVMHRLLKWKWLMVSTTALPWCPNCGSVVAPKRHKYRGQTAMQIHAEWCGETDDDDSGEQLQLESGENDGTVQQETGPEGS